MAVVPVRKACSEPRRHVVPNVGGGMVLLTKQDFDDLKALSTSKEMPRPLPVSGTLASVSLGNSPAPKGASVSAGSGTRWTAPRVERRVRSANGRRPPQPPAAGGASMSQMSEQGSAKNQMGRPEATKRQVHTDGWRGSDAQRPERLRKDASVIQKASSQSAPVSQFASDVRRCPSPRLQKLAPQLGVHGGPLSGGAAGSGTSGRTRDSRGPASCPPSILGGGVGIGGSSSSTNIGGVCGIDPRRLARPADQVLKAVEMGFPVSAPVAIVKEVREATQDRGYKPAVESQAMSLGGLHVSGLPKPVRSAVVSEAELEVLQARAQELEAEGWSSTEDEEEEDTGADDNHSFNYREYRYYRYQEARARALPPEPAARRSLGVRQRRPLARGNASQRDDSAGSGCDQPWTREESPLRLARNQSAPSASSTPCCEEELPDDELSYVGEVLAKFYGLPGGVSGALRLKGNLVAVSEESWNKRKRSNSQLTEPPMLWVRGGRVYDLSGDRGTVAEFGNDLLVRQVEDDAVCRNRRREQGLLPFPFVATPLKRDEDVDEQADGAREAGCGTAINGSRNVDPRKLSHWR